MAFLLAGLGNPGSKYEGTRHNIGFAVLDKLAIKKGLSFEGGRYGELVKFQIGGQTVMLLKPSTFMNLSGDAVLYWMRQMKETPENVLVITDDLALPFGKIRIRAKGSSGGHNGLTDIEVKLQSSSYARMRMGIGSDFPKGQQADYVLSKFAAEEAEQLESYLNRAADACLCYCTRGLSVAMNQFNG
jgi:PTH1 family peptidyl-tRNA hydrolase